MEWTKKGMVMDKFKYCKGCEYFGGEESRILVKGGKLYPCKHGYFKLDCFNHLETYLRKEDLTVTCILHKHVQDFTGDRYCLYAVENNLHILGEEDGN